MMKLKKGYKQTEIGVIPEDWEVKVIGDFTTGFAGGTPSTKESSYWNGDIRWMNSGELNHKFIYDVDNRITQEGLDNSSTKFIPKNCVLIGLAGQGKTRGTAAINFIELCTNQSIAAILPSNKHNTKFLYYFIDRQYYELRKLSTGDGGRGGLNLSIIKNIKVPFPEIEEQKVISDTLNDVDKLIQNLKTLIVKKKAIKQGAMQELLTGKRRLKGFSGDWEIKSLGDIAFIKTGSKNNQDKIGDGQYPFFVRSQTVERIGSYSYDCEAILVPGEGGIGSIFHYVNEKFDVHQRVYVISEFSDKVYGKYIYLYMKEHFGEHAMKNSVKATVDSLRLPTFQVFELYMPKDIEEQRAIAQILSDMDSEIEALEIQLQKTKNLKQGMMQELLTGKIRLVKPVGQTTKDDVAAEVKAKSKIKTLHIAAEPEKDYVVERPRNEHITDAVLIGTMADAFGSNEFPLTRFMYTKVSYLLKRFKEEEDNGYLKKAAGPYKPKTRYGGAEKIALDNDYVKIHTSYFKGKKYENFIAGNNCQEAISYFKKWYGENALQWIQQFKYTKRDQLELWATVDMAMQDLLIVNQLVNFQTVKQLINENKEWRPKLKHSTFSDENIKSGIIKVNQLFG